MNEQIANILDWDRTNLPFGVKGIGWGPKTSNGVETDEYAVLFFVDEKKELKDLDPAEIIPSNFTIDDIEFRTDVQKTVQCKTFIGDCHVISDTVEPVKTNRSRLRPLKPGTETMTLWGQYVATLGAFVTDKSDGQIVALSNSHVYAGSQLIASMFKVNDNGDFNTTNLSGYQPTGYWRTTPENDYIGVCKKGVPIGNISSSFPSIITSCDAAILKLKNYSLIDAVSSLNVLGFNQPGPYKFATEEEINSLVNPSSPNFRAPVFRSGRTCGPVGFPGYSSSCSLSTYAIQDVGVGTYSGEVSTFINCFLVRGDVVAGRGGDSGSAYFALLSANMPTLSTWKMIGLLFAGPDESYPSFSVGCKITTVADDLNIASWNGNIPTISADTQYITANDSNSSIIELSGRKFYQLGRGAV